MKRGDPGRAEDQVLMRALRDFNIPKIITDDLPVFMGLIGDLFPALDVPRKRDLNFEKVWAQAQPGGWERWRRARGWGMSPALAPAAQHRRALAAPWGLAGADPAPRGQLLLSPPDH